MMFCSMIPVLCSTLADLYAGPTLCSQYLENFLRRGPKGYAAYCADRLRRTVANGEREEVPCEMELQVRCTAA